MPAGVRSFHPDLDSDTQNCALAPSPEMEIRVNRPLPRLLQSVRQPMKGRRGACLRFPVESSMVHPTNPASAASRTVSATTSGAPPKPFSRSAETGRSVALTMTRACASASFRVSPPSLLPAAQAEAALDVANAWKPRPAKTRAEPTSHGFGMTKAPGASWRARKRAAFSC